MQVYLQTRMDIWEGNRDEQQSCASNSEHSEVRIPVADRESAKHKAIRKLMHPSFGSHQMDRRVQSSDNKPINFAFHSIYYSLVHLHIESPMECSILLAVHIDIYSLER